MIRTRQMLELMMRLTPPTLALSALLLVVSSVGHSGTAMRARNPVAVTLTLAGETALAQPQGVNTAIDDFETALAVDPTDRVALVGLARASLAQGLPGKAIRYYREALGYYPNDLALLEGQGEALVAKGAFTKANESLAKIRALCLTSCPEQVALSNAIAHGTAQPPISAAQIKINPVLTEGEAKN